MNTNPTISLLHLELFHHWDKQTRATLAFPQIWPVIMQQAFSEDFIVSAILCVAATHLATLCPQNNKYSQASMQLIVKRFNSYLSRPFTIDNCEALMETALIINYISWSDLGFLDANDNDTEFVRQADARMNLAQDQLFLLSPGIVRLWFEAMPVFIDEGSVFTQLTQQHPRLNIETALVTRGDDPTRFVEPFMKMWDTNDAGCKATRTNVRNAAGSDGPTPYAWRLRLELEMELSACHGPSTIPCDGGHDEAKVVHLWNTFTKILPNPHVSTTISHHNTLLESAAAGEEQNPTIMAQLEADIEQLFFGFPIFCCGPFAQLMPQGDSRALVFLFHIYRAARILLASGGRCWWASTRIRLMEEAIRRELEFRDIDFSSIERLWNTVRTFEV